LSVDFGHGNFVKTPTKNKLKQIPHATCSAGEINGNHTTFGIVGSVWVHAMLAATGSSDLALASLLTDSYPGFGHMAAQQMTTLCENWKCGFHDPGGGSQNHIMCVPDDFPLNFAQCSPTCA
jgi:hypothetical protein